MTPLILYHGSVSIITKSMIGFGKTTNDYGLGFYLTEDRELASEWASSKKSACYVNKYQIDTSDLEILDLNSDNYDTLHWLNILIQNRGVHGTTTVMRGGIEYINKHFSIDISQYDVIKGYRSDDSFFSFTRAFLSNQISLEQLSRAMKLGGLGQQFVLKSPKAFDNLQFINYEEVDYIIYSAKYMERDAKARDDFRKELEKDDFEGTFIRDIIREGNRQ